MAEPQLCPRHCGGDLLICVKLRLRQNLHCGLSTALRWRLAHLCEVEVTAEPPLWAIHGTAVDLLLAQLSLPLPRHCSDFVEVTVDVIHGIAVEALLVEVFA